MRAFKGRREDLRLVTGHGRFTSDCTLLGELHACFLRSDRAHARIVRVDTAAAAGAPGVHAVLTWKDLAPLGLSTLRPLLHYPGRGGMEIRVPERPALASDRVRYVGEPLALVVAGSPRAAQDAAETIEVEYEELPVVIGVENALAPGAALVHDSIPGNVCFDFDYGDEAKTAACFARARQVVSVAVRSSRVAPTPMEPRAVLASYDAAADLYEVRCEHQGALAMRESLAAMLGVPLARVRVAFTDIGGAFGARTSPYPEYVVLLAAARRIGRPVKWTSTRSEDFLNDGHGRAMELSGELALDEAGRFLAMRTSWLSDSGAYLSLAGALTNTSNGRIIGAGPYRVEAMYGRQRQVMTHTAPTDAFRGAGRPEAAYIVERLVDEAAARLGADPFELRRRNAVAREAMPYRSATGTLFDSADYRALLDAAERASGWKEFPARSAEARRRGRLRGLGLALFVEPSGSGDQTRDQVAVQFTSSGGLQIYMATGASGQGHETVFPELVGEWLGIDPEKIVLRAGDPDGPETIGAPAIGSRTTFAQGSAFRAAADEVIRKGQLLAAEALEAPAADIEFAGGRFVVKGTDRAVAIGELAERHRAGAATFGAHPLDSTGEYVASRSYPSGAHTCEVEIDPETGEAHIASYLAVDDLGRVINPVLAEGQLHGGVVQSAGQVFGEQCLYDEASGQMLSGSLLDYPLPRADLLAEFRVLDSSVASPNNPLGVKGAGEVGTTGGLPACMNAVLGALRQAGVERFDMPASPLRVWQAIQEAQGRKRASSGAR